MSINKEELLKLIEDAINLEDKSIQIYHKHLKTALFWSGLPESKRAQLNTYMHVLSAESGKHSARLNALKAKIEKGEKNVY
ncbi:MAG TPA: hypothetical protein PKI19_07375 [Elusimicrobiales bacterium]|nr:hypothetical protein [Elusimicrobiales bacterium]